MYVYQPSILNLLFHVGVTNSESTQIISCLTARPRHGNSRRSARGYGSFWKFCHSNRAGGGVIRPRADSAESLQTWQETKPSLFTEARVTPAYKVTSRRVFISRHGAPCESRCHCARGRLNFFSWLAAGHRIVSNICMVWNKDESLRERNKLASVV